MLIETFGPIETYFGGLTNGGALEFYDGPMKIIDKTGNSVQNLTHQTTLITSKKKFNHGLI